jgi:type II secretory pathway pseudopilin PulG
MNQKNTGFTLIEMAMVLVSIGLLIGVVVMGQALVRNARLLSVSADVEIYKNAVASFQNKYRYLPGDMPNAITIWGADNSCPNSPANAIPKTATCNGNGDSYIGDSNGSAFGGATNWQESYRAWQHLSNAGFMDGSFTGALSSRQELGVDPGLNIPASKIQGSGYSMLHVLPGQAAGVYNSNYHHVIIFGTPVGPQASAYGAAINPTEALLIDQKVDDGKPGSGFVLSFTPENPETQFCVSNTSELGSAYDTTVPDISCSLIFITGI